MVDYKDVLLTLVPAAPRTQHLCSFLCELSLLHTSLAAYAPARLAAAALLLARLTHGQSKEPTLHRLLDGAEPGPGGVGTRDATLIQRGVGETKRHARPGPGDTGTDGSCPVGVS